MIRNDDDTPRDLDDLRVRLMRRLADHGHDWVRCPARTCRRARRCVDAAVRCAARRATTRVGAGASRDESEAERLETAQAMAAFQVALKAAVARHDALADGDDDRPRAGAPMGNRTPVFAVRGRRPNR